MNFELSDEICNLIIFAMEDQKNSFVFDSVDCVTVEKASVQNLDKDRYYSMPVWGSVQGFKIMERFVSLLHNPLAREELRAVLFSGHGVFRNYKNVLNRYPEIERLWFSFKQKEMKSEIYRWYNVLRDSWGLELLGDVPESTDENLPSYFNFSTLKNEEDFKKYTDSISVIEQEILDVNQDEIGKVLVAFWRNLRNLPTSSSSITLFAQSISDDFAGAISILIYPEDLKQTVVVTSFFVLPEFRGLGIGKELLAQSINLLSKNGVRTILLPNLTVPKSFIPALLRHGFIQQSGNFIADLHEESVTE